MCSMYRSGDAFVYRPVGILSFSVLYHSSPTAYQTQKTHSCLTEWHILESKCRVFLDPLHYI